MLNLDTHILVSMLIGDLSNKEFRLIENERLAISDIVLWELAKLIEIGRLKMDLEASEFHKCLRYLTIIPISLEIAWRSTHLDFSSDPADEIIAATSVVEKIPLLTRDRQILKSGIVPFPTKTK
ncbi:MAG: type II toxin-antitoxin system VapC family toxin [Pyrinomonadaceae bacterium]